MIQSHHGPPQSEQALLERAVALSGHRLGEIAAALEVDLPPDARRAKGWIGMLIENALGATAGSAAAPDFPQLGIELKTIPVRPDGRPVESTWVTRVPLVEGDDQLWQHSVVQKKLARVLWMPVQGDTGVDLAERRMGSPLLWSPDDDQAARLRADFEDVMELIVLGRVDEITASLGDCLQIRPKGADSRDRVDGIDFEGQIVPVAPRGFYLRASFTREILRRGFGLDAR